MSNKDALARIAELEATLKAKDAENQKLKAKVAKKSEGRDPAKYVQLGGTVVCPKGTNQKLAGKQFRLTIPQGTVIKGTFGKSNSGNVSFRFSHWMHWILMEGNLEVLEDTKEAQA